ncbi:MAG: hypothetical protein DI598_03675 [Pseudopedobacter saltans]|uniref:Tetratricopeptide repeat protein n=1 Tax=Pseudopedobacter saltans TaxID=151895 RepID=A0A2W5FAG2_9SPHI|nr:MAG: hypothetical protein DI598_03675 [Pseudopedobacter saltans]
MVRAKRYVGFLSLLILCLVNTVRAQNFDTRRTIDQQRTTIDISKDEALAQAREFIRMDSTYYVGYMIEGQYLYNHASDYQGFLYAIEPLMKAKNRLLRENHEALSNQFLSMAQFTDNLQHFQDYMLLANNLTECYNNTDQPDKNIQMIDQLDSFNFRKDYFGVASHKAWIYHRYRTFTSRDYSFLKNSIAENERAALDWCNIGLQRIDENKDQNDAWFGPNQAAMDQLTIFHYLALLTTYNKQYDSSNFYYQALEKSGIISWNNYGGLQLEVGNFATAIQYYSPEMNPQFEHMLQEPYYYSPELLVYKGATKEAIQMTKGIIQQNGSMPGFGWYNIALARSYLYDGQLDSCALALNKAENFREVSIGTTLTEKQYKFTIQVLRVAQLNRAIVWEKFTHKNWWYSPKHLFTVLKLKIQRFFAKYVLSNTVKHDPDRERMVYDLFCSETTITFDEVWDLLQGFNDNYFIKKYDGYIANDKRTNITKYFKLLKAKFQLENGDRKDAEATIDDLVHNSQFDPDNEKLFIGRLYEVAAQLYDEKGDSKTVAFYQNELLKVYPQLLPFSGVDCTFKLQFNGDENAANVITSALNKSQVNWKDRESIPIVNINIESSDDKKAEVLIETSDIENKPIGDVTKISIDLNDKDMITQSILQKAFAIGD